jgi:hypothetical protein
LPSSQTDGGDLVAGVESVGLLSVVGHCDGSFRGRGDWRDVE